MNAKRLWHFIELKKANIQGQDVGDLAPKKIKVTAAQGLQLAISSVASNSGPG